MGVVLFHPSVAPFVQQAARALHEARLLARFCTTIRDNPHGTVQGFACTLARGVRFDLRRALARRAVTEVPAELVRSHAWREWVRLAIGALDRSGRATDVAWEWAEPGFDRWVSRQLGPEVCGVYGYEHSSLATFEAARARGLGVAYDVPAPEAGFVRRLLQQEVARFPDLNDAYQHHIAPREARRQARRRAEWEAADVVIAASQFTRDSYVAAGVDPRTIRVVPYGAPPPTAGGAVGGGGRAPLELLWAGTFSIRKGAHYLLEAWRTLHLGRHARLVIHGAVTLPVRLLQPLPDGVVIAGSVPRSQLLEACTRADALIFPTLCDGFGLVVLEAFSRGLPVITTERAGAADFVVTGRNGLRIKPADAAAIAEAIQWCLDHRCELAAMRETARQTAANWQWSDYRARLLLELKASGVYPDLG